MSKSNRITKAELQAAIENVRGWYHGASQDNHNPEFFFSEERPAADESTSWHGPFKSFSEAKRDAIDYFMADVRNARWAIRNIKAKNKPAKQVAEGEE